MTRFSFFGKRYRLNTNIFKSFCVKVAGGFVGVLMLSAMLMCFALCFVNQGAL